MKRGEMGVWGSGWGGSRAGLFLSLASSTLVPMVGFACSSHYPGRVALLRSLAARLSSPLIEFRYIKPPGQGTILTIKHSIFSTLHETGGVQLAQLMVIGYLFKLPQVSLHWFW